MRYHLKVAGFSLIELVIIIGVLAVLAALTYSYAVPKYRERTYYTRAVSEMHTQANALTLYVAKYNDYPADVTRDIAPGTEEFLQGQYEEGWPDAPWPGSVFDYDRWDDIGVVQISTRFCSPGDTPTCFANANKYLKGIASDNALANWDAWSSVYYCIKGLCRSHQSKPADHPGYCINCGNKSQFY